MNCCEGNHGSEQIAASETGASASPMAHVIASPVARIASLRLWRGRLVSEFISTPHDCLGAWRSQGRKRKAPHMTANATMAA